MKKIILFIAAATAVASVAQAQQELIAGFDFSTFGGTNQANYSDLGLGGAVNDGAGAGAFGSFSFTDGTTRLNNIAQTQFNNTDLTAGTSLFSSIRSSGVNDTFGDGGSLIAEELLSGSLSADGGFFDFAIDTSSTGSAYTNFQFGFSAGQSQSGTTTVGVSYSLDGTNFTNIQTGVGISETVANGGSAYSFNTSGFSATNVTFRVNFTDIAVGTNFDNIQVAGTAVPEPSTYAAIVGAIALGITVVRRRRKNQVS